MKAGRRGEWLVTLPSLGWLLVFFLVPTLIVFAFAFKPSDPFGGIGAGWTLGDPRRDRRPPVRRDRLAHGLDQPADHGALPAAGDARRLRHRAGRSERCATGCCCS